MLRWQLSRREFLLTSSALALASGRKPVVSVVRIQNDNIAKAVDKAISLLGGIKHVTKGVNTVMLKPNLVSSQAAATTKLTVMRALAEAMQRAGGRR